MEEDEPMGRAREMQEEEEDDESAGPISRTRLLELQTIISDANGDYPSDEIPQSHASFVRSLSLTMDSGGKVSLSAADVYLSLLVCRDSPISLFTPLAFLSVLRTIRLAIRHRKDVQPRQTYRRNIPRKKSGRSSSHTVNGSVENEEEIGEENEEFGIEDLTSVLENLDAAMGRISLERFSDSLKSLIDVVTQVLGVATDLEGETSGKVRKLGANRRHSAGRNLISFFCFKILIRVLDPQHGNRANTCVDVLRSLSPLLLSHNSLVRSAIIQFVTSNLMEVARECEDVKTALVALPRYLAVKAETDKIDSRMIAVDSVTKVLQSLGPSESLEFSGFVVKMSMGKARLRMMAVDLVVAVLGLLPDPLAIKDGCSEDPDSRFMGLRCLESLVNRCSDKVAGIRARALTNLAQVVENLSGDMRNRARLQEVLGFGNGVRLVPSVPQKDNVDTLNSELGKQGLFFNKETISPDMGPGPTPITPGVSCRDFNTLLRRRCSDERAAVRKSALLLITKCTSLLGRVVDETMLATIGLACSDPLVSIRKAGLSALSEVFRRFSDNWIITEWFHSVPQMILDNESSIQTECENMFLELVLERISRVASASATSNRSRCLSANAKANLELELESVFPEGVLFLLMEMNAAEVSPSIRKICANLGKKGSVTATIALALQNIITTSESLWFSRGLSAEKWVAPSGAWMLLSIVSEFVPKAVGWKFLEHQWKLHDKATGLQSNVCTTPMSKDTNEGIDGFDSMPISWAGDRVFLLHTISNVAVQLPPETAASLAHDLLSRLEAFDMHAIEVDAHVQALKTLCKRKSVNTVDGDKLVLQWVEQLLSRAFTVVEKHISVISEASNNGDFETPCRSRSNRSKHRKGKTQPGSSSLQAVSAVFTIGSLVLVCPSSDPKNIIPLLQTIITSGRTEQRPKNLAGFNFSKTQISPSLYIQAWVTMGKICLVDDKLAKRYIPLFIQELEKSESAPLRNNIMVVMTDFCVRYTALVDCYITKITRSLRDPCEIVRRQTFILLSRLLQRDYVKWRGVLFHRFLLALVDESEKIRRLADFLFGSFLKTKAPLLAYNSFIEAIFLLNGCKAHSLPNESLSGQRLFAIRGCDDESQSQRMHIYTSLLQQMAPEQILATSAKLCAEILAAAADSLLNLNDSAAQSVLKDALQILACKEMRLQQNRSTATAIDSTEMDEEGGSSNGAFIAARGRIVTQIAKKNLVQNAIPVFIELKRLLESKNSPLIGSLMECLRQILKEYKNEIDEILVADKQLQKELLYDMQKFESSMAKSPEAGAAAAPAVASCHRSANVNVAASATVGAVLKDISNGVPTPPLHSMSIPKVKTALGTNPSGSREHVVLESLRRRETFSDADGDG